MKVAVILPAAGLGTRMGQALRRESRHQPQAVHAARRRRPSCCIPCGSSRLPPRRARSWSRCAPEDLEWVGELLRREVSGREPVRVVEGGDSRQQSVENALAALDPETDLVAVHDAVRPFIDWKPFDRVIRRSRRNRRGHRGHRAGRHGETGERRATGKARSAPPFRAKNWCWRKRHRSSATICCERPSSSRAKDGFIGTDESSLVERLDQSKSAWCWAATATSRSPSPAIWIWRGCSWKRKLAKEAQRERIPHRAGLGRPPARRRPPA